MTTVKQVVGARSAVTFSGLSTLAAANFVQSTAAYLCNTNQPLDVAIELSAQVASAPGSNKQALVYIRESLDGTNYRSGPTSGSTTTDEPNLMLVGVLPINSSGVTERATFSLLAALKYIPYDFFIIIKNESGQAFSSAAVAVSEISELF